MRDSIEGLRNAQRYKYRNFIFIKHGIQTDSHGWRPSFYFENHSNRKSWVNSGVSFTSTTRWNHFGSKTLLWIWWDKKKIIYYRVLVFGGGTVNIKRYDKFGLQKTIKRHVTKSLFLHDIHSSIDMANPDRVTLEVLKWKMLVHASLPSVTTSLHRWLMHVLRNAFIGMMLRKNSFNESHVAREMDFYWHSIHQFFER